MAQTVYDPPVATYIPLQTITLGSAASSVTFASIPQTYRDLVLIIAGGLSATNRSVEIQLNGDTSTSNYPSVYMHNSGSSGASATASKSFFTFDDADSNAILQLMDYSATDKHKSMLVRSNLPGSTSLVRLLAGRWENTDAITSVLLTDTGGETFDVGSTFSLYAIEA